MFFSIVFLEKAHKKSKEQGSVGVFQRLLFGQKYEYSDIYLAKTSMQL